jgi:hypothetical protein
VPLLASFSFAVRAATTDKPNIVVIYADDLGYGRELLRRDRDQNAQHRSCGA